jgi:hypothetical protein
VNKSKTITDNYFVHSEDRYFLGLPSIAGPCYRVYAIENGNYVFEGTEEQCKDWAWLLNKARRERKMDHR